MEKYIDLHTHSTASDGTFTPTELVNHALRQNLKALALTDHDTTDGLQEAANAALGTTLELIPGIEFSSTWQNASVHIVGLDIDWQDPYFQETLRSFQQSREERNNKIISLLQKEGFSITAEAIKEAFPESTCTRANLARFLVDRQEIPSIKEAFDRYLGDRAKCYVPREHVSPFQAVRLIHDCGGIAVFAHPVLCKFSAQRLESLVNELKKAGLDALEVFYSSYRPAEESAMMLLAKRHGLKLSGGSDFHGDNKPQIQLGTGRGNLKIPYTVLQQLRG